MATTKAVARNRKPRSRRKADGSDAVIKLPVVNAEPTNTASDAKSAEGNEDFIWNDDSPLRDSMVSFGKRLAKCHGLAKCPALYQRPSEGLLYLGPDGKPADIINAADFAPVIADLLRLTIKRDGKCKGGNLSATVLNAMLRSRVFRSCFTQVDRITTTPEYLPDFSLTQPGDNNGVEGHRVVYVGSPAKISDSLTLINDFLDEMAFPTDADRTNAVAAILTVMLHTHWPGGKPIIVVTATKSHAGKDTVILFAVCIARHTSISYQATNWALERNFVGAMKLDPDVAVVVIENARLDGRESCIASAFVERFATDPEPLLFSTGTGKPARRRNDIVLAVSTNYGSVSEDILNRSLPIHLAPKGNVADRQSRIGNPKLEYLPENREGIAAEVRGMIQRWKDAGMPLDKDVRHPFSIWAQTVGGILKVNGFQDFLSNYGVRRTSDDPVREGLGILGMEYATDASDEGWERPHVWAEHIRDLGLTKRLIPRGDQDSEPGRCRGAGVVLSTHLVETFVVENEDEQLTLRLEKRRIRSGDKVNTCYRFFVVDRVKSDEEEM